MKNIEKEISFIKNKIAETEKSYQKEQESLEGLSDRLVKKIADNMIKPSGQREKEIEKITNQVRDLKNKVGFTPKILEALKEKISLLEKERAELILKNKIEEQKALGAELAKKSGSFIRNLKLAIKENSEIRSLWVSWNELKEQTGLEKFEARVSLGSQEMLGILGILVGEYEKNIIRKQSVFNRIRL